MAQKTVGIESRRADSKSAPAPAPATAKAPKSDARIISLDALRGFDMFWIVGGQQLMLALAAFIWASPPAWIDYQLEHVPWEGFVAWDLIMPLFLFVVGAAMPFSFSRRVEQGQSKAGLYSKIIRRSIILFVLGMIVQGHLLDFDLSTLHIYCNTLQAIAAGYLVAGILLLNVGLWGRIAATVVLLVAYWLLLTFVPFDGHPAGTLEPDANLALSIDTLILGQFRDGTPYTWILSSMTFAATVMLGVFSGEILRSAKPSWQKLLWLVGLGGACLAGGWAWSEWGGFPIIKHVWTSSMTLWAAGWSYLLLALFYLVIDVIGLRWLAFPFVVIGMNAITIYMANWFIPFRGISETLVGGLSRLLESKGKEQVGSLAHYLTAAGPLLVQLTAMLLVWLLLYHLYRQKIFLRI